MGTTSDYRALPSGIAWNGPSMTGQPIVLTYSFASTPAYYAEAEQPGWMTNFQPHTEWEKQEVRRALGEWSKVSGITFIEVSKHVGDMVFSFINMADSGDVAAAGRGGQPFVSYLQDAEGKIRPYASEHRSAGDIVFDNGYRARSEFQTDFFFVALHEIGHAIGLKHPHEANYPNPLVLQPDPPGSTVMSYQYRLQALGTLDVPAAQYLYGTAKGTNWSYDAAKEAMSIKSAGMPFLRGTSVDDVITAGTTEKIINSSMGNDIVYVGSAAIVVKAGDGVDIVYSGATLGARNLNSNASWSYYQDTGVVQEFENVEYIHFADGVINTANKFFASNQKFQQFEAAYRTLVATPAPYATSESASTSGKTTAAYVTELLNGPAKDSTIPAIMAYSSMLGRAPDKAALDNLAKFVSEQVNSVGYQATSDPRLGGFEAMGLALADLAPSVASSSGKTDAAFASDTYQMIFGRTANAMQVSHFSSQIDYFEGLYTGVGINGASAAIKARGAVFGQMLGYAAKEDTNQMLVSAQDTLSSFLKADGWLT